MANVGKRRIIPSCYNSLMKSPTKQLYDQDWKQWAEETVIFSFIIPGIIVFITSLNNGMDFRTAGVVSAISLSTAAVNLYGKYKNGETPFPVSQEVITTVHNLEPIIEKETEDKLTTPVELTSSNSA